MTEEVINPKRFVQLRENKKDPKASSHLFLPLYLCSFLAVSFQKHSTGHHSVHGHSYYIIRAGERSLLHDDDRRRAAEI